MALSPNKPPGAGQGVLEIIMALNTLSSWHNIDTAATDMPKSFVTLANFIRSQFRSTKCLPPLTPTKLVEILPLTPMLQTSCDMELYDGELALGGGTVDLLLVVFVVLLVVVEVVSLDDQD